MLGLYGGSGRGKRDSRLRTRNPRNNTVEKVTRPYGEAVKGEPARGAKTSTTPKDKFQWVGERKGNISETTGWDRSLNKGVPYPRDQSQHSGKNLGSNRTD